MADLRHVSHKPYKVEMIISASKDDFFEFDTTREGTLKSAKLHNF